MEIDFATRHLQSK